MYVDVLKGHGGATVRNRPFGIRDWATDPGEMGQAQVYVCSVAIKPIQYRPCTQKQGTKYRTKQSGKR